MKIRHLIVVHCLTNNKKRRSKIELHTKEKEKKIEDRNKKNPKYDFFGY